MRCADIIRMVKRGVLPSLIPDVHEVIDTNHGWTLLHLLIIYGPDDKALYDRLFRLGASWSAPATMDLVFMYRKRGFIDAMTRHIEFLETRLKSSESTLEEESALRMSYKRKIDSLSKEHKNLEDSFNGLAESLRKKRKLSN